MRPIRIALLGAGKIARDQHVPALAANGAFELVAAVSPHQRLDGVPHYASLEALLEGASAIDAVSVCTPPQLRYALARYALERGCHVLLEKPPGATVAEVQALIGLAASRGLALFASWHSREAAGVEPARDWLAQRRVRAVRVQWKEDVRVWHPGQRWIWQAGGLGVFDPGINALSILTRILPGTLMLQDAELDFPSNCATPIAARLRLLSSGDAPVSVALDFRCAGSALWDIEVDTEDGRLQLSQGGSVLQVDGEAVLHASDGEYSRLYARFADLIAQRRIDVDLAPLQLVADAFLCGRRVVVAAFVE
jgi:D-galactose 1-dehydrogenase